MNLNSIDPQSRNIVLMLEELRRRRTTIYAQALDCIIDKLPESTELDGLRQHRQAYIDSLEKIQ